MGKKKDPDDWKGLLALFGGFWLLKQILASNKVNYFRCWHCNKFLLPNTNPCPYCGVSVDWQGGQGSV